MSKKTLPYLGGGLFYSTESVILSNITYAHKYSCHNRLRKQLALRGLAGILRRKSVILCLYTTKFISDISTYLPVSTLYIALCDSIPFIYHN